MDEENADKTKAYNRRYYLANREQLRARSKKYRATRDGQKYRKNYVLRRRDRRNKLIGMLGGKCVRCGISDPLVLDFDHIDAATKEQRISQLIVGDARLDRLIAEAKKCQLLCANCHRIKTYAPERFRTS